MKRLALVVAAAIGGFAAAIIHFTHAQTAQTCLGEYPRDSSYSAHFTASVTMSETNHTIVVTHNGAPVSGGQLCLDTWMTGMSGMAMTTNGTEQSSGHYQVPFQFAMGGPWQANVVITKPNGQQIGVPITFNVDASGVNIPGATAAP